MEDFLEKLQPHFISFFKEKLKIPDGIQKKLEAPMEDFLKNILNSKSEYEADAKNSDDSIRYRKEGNQYFGSGDDIKAIEYYTKSLAYADNQELMAYARGNRSACLFNMKMFKECLIDIDAALSLGYPQEKCKKLLNRRIKTLTEIQQMLNINLSPPEDEKSLGSEFESSDNTKINKETEEEIYKMLMSKTESIKQPRYITDEGEPKLLYGPSKEAPVASDGVEIAHSVEFGRYLVATKVFNPGDILMMENPFVYAISTNCLYTHCDRCLKSSYNLIPCPVCPIAQYCSEECREAAWNSEHKLECPVLILFKSALINESSKPLMNKLLTNFRISLRFLITITKGGKAIKELRHDIEFTDLNQNERTAGFTDEGIFDTASARSALSLATNITTLPRDRIAATGNVSAKIGLLLATETDFFGNQYQAENLLDSDIFRDLVFCGALLLRSSLINNSNNYGIEQYPLVVSGGGLYIMHSLYNHSCEANAIRHFNDLTLITRALGRINPGEQIFVNYGPSSVSTPKAERESMLSNGFFFKCNCLACAENWPTQREIFKNNIGSVVTKPHFFETVDPSVFSELYSRTKDNNYDIKAIKALFKLLLDANVIKPCAEIVWVEWLLRDYYVDP